MANKLLKCIFALILIACFLYMPIHHSPNSSEASPFVLYFGDSNCDGAVNTFDAVSILKYCVGTYDLGFYGFVASDVDMDDEINTKDASTLLRLIVSSSDILLPMEIVGDLKNPVLYTDINYMDVTEDRVFNISLSMFTADAIESPKNTVAFGQGYTVELEAGKNYVFETQSSGGIDIDTVLYLMDGANNAFLTDDNGGDEQFSRIEFYAWQGGTYKLLVTGKNASDVGTCRLKCGERIYVESVPTQKPTSSQTPKPSSSPKQTDTPKPTATPTPTSSPSPSPSQSPTGDLSFENQTVPTDNEAVQYKDSYQLKGTVTARKPISSVRVDILNKDGSVEMTAERKINSSLELTRYSLTDGGATSINSQLKFAELSIGKKKFKLYCTSGSNSEKLVFTSDFIVGATDKLLAANGYMDSSALTSSQRRGILDYINALDEDSLGGKVIQEAFTYLGVPYGTGSGQVDCSLLVQRAYGSVGVNLPRVSHDQGKYCYGLNGEIPRSELRPGDLVFLTSNHCNCGRFREIHHVGFIIGPIDGTRYYLEASSGRRRTVLRREWGVDSDLWSLAFYSRP